MTQMRGNDSTIFMSDLSEEEIDYICQQITPHKIRSYFKRYPKEFNKIFPGFRVTHLSDESTIMLVRKNIMKDFIALFIRKQLDEWRQEIEEYRTMLEEKGETPQKAILNTIPQSVFAGNVRLFFKVTGEHEQFTEEYITLAESALQLLSEKENEVKNRIETLDGSTDKRTEKSEIEILKDKQNELSGQITRLEQKLEAEKTAHSEAEKAEYGIGVLFRIIRIHLEIIYICSTIAV